MESNCRKLVSACVQLGKKHRGPPARRRSGPAAVRSAARVCSQAGRPRGNGAASAKGCAASGADHLPTQLPLPCADPPRPRP